jgi:hypothetical protein
MDALMSVVANPATPDELDCCLAVLFDCGVLSYAEAEEMRSCTTSDEFENAVSSLLKRIWTL